MDWLFIFWAVFSHLKQFDTWKEKLVVKLQFWKLMTRLQGQAPSLIKCKHFIFSPLPNFLTEQNAVMRIKDMRDKHFSSNILFEMTILWDEQAQKEEENPCSKKRELLKNNPWIEYDCCALSVSQQPFSGSLSLPSFNTLLTLLTIYTVDNSQGYFVFSHKEKYAARVT